MMNKDDMEYLNKLLKEIQAMINKADLAYLNEVLGNQVRVFSWIEV